MRSNKPNEARQDALLRPVYHKLTDVASDEQRARHEEMMCESLTFLFNESLGVLDPVLSTVSHETISLLREYFPRYGI